MKEYQKGMMHIISILLLSSSCFLCLNCYSTTKSSANAAPPDESSQSESIDVTSADVEPQQGSTDVEPSSPIPSKYLYITNQYLKTISKINLADFVLEENLDFSESPSIVSSASDGTFVVSFDSKTNELAIIDSKTDDVKLLKLNISNVIDIQLSPSDESIYLLSSDKKLGIIDLDPDDFSVKASQLKTLDTTPQKMLVTEKNIFLYAFKEELESVTPVYYPVSTDDSETSQIDPPLVLNENISFKTKIGRFKNYLTDALTLSLTQTDCSIIKSLNNFSKYIDKNQQYIVVFCDEKLIIYDLENTVIARTIDLPFGPINLVINEDKDTFYLFSLQNSSSNLLKIKFIDIETESQSLMSIADIADIKYMVSAKLDSIDYEHLFILDDKYLYDFDPLLQNITNKYDVDNSPLKIHYYKSSLFVTHDISIGHILRINNTNGAKDELTGFALSGWFDR